jgi:Fe-S-cluster containining protein
MRCSHCGECCKETEMLLSNADVKLLEKNRNDPVEFSFLTKDGFTRLRNVKGFCFFFDVAKRRCKAYELRPLGCRIYPIIYSEDEGVIVDWICPMRNTVSKEEIRVKNKKLLKLLKAIDEEARKRKQFK